MQLSFAHQTWSWNCLDLLQRFKSELGPSIMHDFTILSLHKHPSILHIPALFLETVVQRVLHNTQSILAYVTFQTFCQSPNYCTQVAFGYFPPPDCAHFGGILTHFGIHNEWKMGGINHVCCWAESYGLHFPWFNLIIPPWLQVHSLVPVLFVQDSLPSFTQIKLITAESKF